MNNHTKFRKRLGLITDVAAPVMMGVVGPVNGSEPREVLPFDLPDD